MASISGGVGTDIPYRQDTSDTPSAERTLDLLALLVVVVCALHLAGVFVTVPAWRHDELAYMGSHAPKLSEEGRWVNHLLFPLLRRMPPELAWLLGFTAFAAFGARLGRLGGLGWPRAISLGLTLALAPAAIDQSCWPATALPATLGLLVASLTVGRLSLPVFYLLWGVLLIGAYQQFYFVLPLLHLPWALRRPDRALRRALVAIGWWILGFVAGGAVSLAAVWAMLGQVGLALAPWRQPNPVVDLASLGANALSRAVYLREHLALLLSPALAGAALVVAAALALREDRPQQRLARIVVCGVVVLALYATTLPLGVLLQPRSLGAASAGLLAAAFLGPHAQRGRVWIGALTVVAVSWFAVDLNNAEWLRGVMRGYRDGLVATSPVPPGELAGLVVVSGDACDLQHALEETLDRTPTWMEPELCVPGGPDYRWRPAVLATGFRELRFCAGDPSCAPELAGVDLTHCAPGSDARHCVHGVSPSGRLVLSLTHGPALRRPPAQSAAPPPLPNRS